MNTASLDSKLAQGPTPCASGTAGRGKELIALGLILVACNLHLITGAFPSSTAFLSGRVAAGEWWRVVTHAFAHLSWYHLALDGSAFLILYHSLPIATRGARLGVVVAAIAGSLTAAVLADSRVAEIGFCGLSGAAHGLMGVATLIEMRSADRTRRRLGIMVFTGFIAKCVLEAITGGAFLGEFHFGNVGTPIGVCHGGGALGGLLAGFATMRCVEAAIPLAALGLKPAPNVRYKMDWGILTTGQDGNEVLRRIYWSNRATSITADAPSEARLHPDLWGWLRFHNEPPNSQLDPTARKKDKSVEDLLNEIK